MKPKAILFDLDGTLIDSVPDLATAVDTVLVAMGFAAAGIENVRAWIGNGAAVLIQRALADAKGIHMNELDTEETRVALAHFMTIYRDGCCYQSRLYRGVISTLQSFLNNGYRMAIVTNKPYEFALQISRHYGLEQLCPVLLGGDSVATKKPDPAMLLEAAKRLDVKLSDCVMVGDSKSDVVAAKAAGINCYAVSYGYHRDEDLLALGAVGLFDNFEELLQAI